MNPNISHIHNCFGCGVCSIACGQKIIDIRLNEDGFYEPFITQPEKCTQCGLCYDVCSFSHDSLALKTVKIKSYAGWSNDEDVRQNCSSGGVGFELKRAFINQGNKVCAVRYNAELNRAEHYIATTIEELLPSRGSKYIQSYTVDGFKSINRKEKYLVTGTPCQIDSFRRYIQKFKIEDNFILVDFFCHGVPSKLMWDKYLQNIEKVIGKTISASWRNKSTGWHYSYVITILGSKGNLFSPINNNNKFFQFFFSDTCLNKACYNNCKFKYKQSSADIRIGDLLGKTYQYDEKGVSAVITFTKIGNDLLHQTNCSLKEHPFDVVAEGQMKSCPTYKPSFIAIQKALKEKDLNIDEVYKILLRIKRKEKIIGCIKNPTKILLTLKKKLWK